MFKEQLQVIRRFYSKSFLFFLADIALACLYIGANPYRVCRRFFQKKGEREIHMYGETPLTLWAEIVKKAQVSRLDRLIDLGCGRGRLCLWTSFWIGCHVTGIDWVPSFISRGRLLSRLFRLSSLGFDCIGISQVSLKEVSVVFLYTYHPDEYKIDFKQLPKGARVITVSESLHQEDFITTGSVNGVFPWGKTTIFINKKL